MSTWSYRSPEKNSDDLGDVPTFTRLLFEGAVEYKETLDNLLLTPSIIAPCGAAFLLLWESDIDMWKRLFVSDNYHPSPLGTALIARVIKVAVFGKGRSGGEGTESDVLWEVAERACGV